MGERVILTLDELRKRRDSEVAFLLAKLTLEKYFRQDGEARTDRPSEHSFDAEVQAWLFPQLLAITRRWLAECVTCKDNTFPQLLLLVAFAHDAADRIYKSIVATSEGTPALRPLSARTTWWAARDTWTSTRPILSPRPTRRGATCRT